MLQRSETRLARALALLLAVTVSAAAVGRVRAEVGALVPAYFYPVAGSPWDDLIDAAATIPITAILNPASGPGGAEDPNYTSVVEALRTAGGTVVGYVHSSWGRRPLADVIAEIDRYANWYDVDGIFIDEMSTDTATATLDYYAEVYDHIKQVDSDLQVIGNPGIQTSAVYLSRPVADLLVVSEDAGNAYPAYRPSAWNFDHPAEQFAHLVHDVSDAATMEFYVQLGAARNAGWLFLTDDTLPNPWDRLPSYWDAEVTALRTADPGGTPISGQSTQSKVVPDGGIQVVPGDVDRSDWEAIPWYPADTPDAAGPEVDYHRVAVANDSERLFFRFLLNQSEPLGWRHHIMIDADRNRMTGFVGAGEYLSIGVDYMLEGATLYAFGSEDPQQWKWTQVANAVWDANPTTDVEMALPRSAIGDPAALDFLVYGNSSQREDYYPYGSASGLGGDMFTYVLGRLGDMDQDGNVDINDIGPFASGLADEGDYLSSFGLPPSARGDLDQDGDHDFDDIPGFVALLAAGRAVAPVAEPASLWLATVALALWCGYRPVRYSGSIWHGCRTARRSGRADLPV